MTFVDGLYSELLQRGIGYFFPNARWSPSDEVEPSPGLAIEVQEDGSAHLAWLGQKFHLTHTPRPFSEAELRVVRSIGRVLWSRYQMLFDVPLAAQSYHFFRGLPEDRYVSAFLDPAPYRDAETVTRTVDRISEAIGVLRISSSTTYENRRIETGVLLFGSHKDNCHPPPELPRGALRYSDELTAIRSFHRLCDGLQTVALVNSDGMLVEIVDVHAWARPFEQYPVAVPTADRFRAHTRATLCGGHMCLVLTPNGEIKVFAEGVEMFRFLDGHWRLTDAAEKYRMWEESLGNTKLAERLFHVAMNLAEERRGGLFVVLRQDVNPVDLVSPGDLLRCELGGEREGKRQLHYLLRGARVLDLPASVLETVARIDGAIVIGTDCELLTFGAILRSAAEPGAAVAEGGRTTAALAASRYGDVLKVSEDGLITFFRDGVCVWEM